MWHCMPCVVVKTLTSVYQCDTHLTLLCCYTVTLTRCSDVALHDLCGYWFNTHITQLRYQLGNALTQKEFLFSILLVP